jgi:hypothetical protein
VRRGSTHLALRFFDGLELIGFKAHVEDVPSLVTNCSGEKTMKMRIGKVNARPDLLFKGDKRDSVARVLEDDEIRQIEQAKDPEEALTKALDASSAKTLVKCRKRASYLSGAMSGCYSKKMPCLIPCASGTT